VSERPETAGRDCFEGVAGTPVNSQGACLPYGPRGSYRARDRFRWCWRLHSLD